MDKHALALLSDAALWEKVGLTKFEASHPGLVTSLLFHLVVQSQALGGSFLNEFWQNFRKCHPRLAENVNKLDAAPELILENEVCGMLFEGIPVAEFNWAPIIFLAGEYFAHLGLAFMKPRDCLGLTYADRWDESYDSGEETDDEAGGYKEDDIEKHLALDIQEKGLPIEQILKYSALNRGGFSCVITGLPLQYPQSPHSGFRSALIHELNIDRCRPLFTPIIPMFINESAATLRCIAVLAGDSTRQFVQSHISTVGNVMVLECEARHKFDRLTWAVEPLEGKYIYRRTPMVPGPGPVYIKQEDGNEIKFGTGRDGERLGVGPLPELCRLRLAVTRALTSGGASALMGRLIEADDDDDPPIDMCRSSCETVPSSYYLQIACGLPNWATIDRPELYYGY